MKKIKKPLDRADYNKGYQIVEITDELAEKQFSKPEENRGTQWKGVTLATDSDVEKWGNKKQKNIEKVFDKEEEKSKADLLKKVDESIEMAELVQKENEELKARLKELEAEKKVKQETKQEVTK